MTVARVTAATLLFGTYVTEHKRLGAANRRRNIRKGWCTDQYKFILLLIRQPFIKLLRENFLRMPHNYYFHNYIITYYTLDI